MKNLTKPSEVIDYVSTVDLIVNEIEKQIKTVLMDEFGSVKVSLVGEYPLSDKQVVADMYREIGWGKVSFMTVHPKHNVTINKTHTTFTFKK